MRSAAFALVVTVVSSLAGGGCSADTASTVAKRPAATAASYKVGLRPRAVAVADLNGDGALDMAVANSGDNTVSILLGRGAAFRLDGTYPAGNEPCDVKVGDVDHDGDHDLVIANHETSDVTVLINDGAGHFPPAQATTLSTGARPHIHSVTLADIDGDGWLDIAVESADTQEVRLRRGGSSAFGPITPIDVRTMPYTQISAADMSGDGVADILVPGHRDKTVRLITKGGSQFALAPMTITTLNTPWVVAAADVNGDKGRDVIVVETDAVTVWLKNGSDYRAAAWSPLRVPGATSVATGDLDGDGVHDLVIGAWDSSEIVAVAGAPPMRRAIAACARPIGLAVADLDNDGLGEIVATCATEARVMVVRSPFTKRRGGGRAR